MLNLDDLSMLQIFQLEAKEHLENLARDAVGEGSQPPDAEATARMMRELHTLKGAARLVQLEHVQKLAHALESLLQAISRSGRQATAVEVDWLLATIDLLAKLVREAEAASPPDVSAEIEALEEMAGQLPPAPPQAKPAESPPAREQPAVEEGFVRVPVERLDSLLALTGEFHTLRMRLLRVLRQFQNLSRPIGRLDGDWRQVAALHADGSPGTRQRFEALIRANSKSGGLLRKEFEADMSIFDELLLQLERVNLEFSDTVTQARMLPLDYIFQPFPRLVRDLAMRLGKEAALHCQGADARLDRDVLEALREPLVHLLQNAIDHGVEPPEERIARGKPSCARIELLAEYQGDGLQVRVRDDGRGIAREQIRARAAEKGLRAGEDALSLIFRPGITTAAAVTELSGRGVGLDAVRAAVEAMQGTIRVASEAGAGTEFTIRLPLSMSVTRVLLAKAAGVLYAFPVDGIRTLVQATAGELKTTDGQAVLAVHDELLPMMTLESWLGTTAPRSPDEGARAVVLSSAARRVAITVDRFLDEEDVIVKPIDPRLGKLRGLLGAAITRAGDVALVLDERQLATLPAAAAAQGPERRQGAVDWRERTFRVLVVEDSRTQREVNRRVLATAGYEVLTACDGQEALDVLGTEPVDLLVTDVTMPGMDGFGLTRRIKSDPALQGLPVLMLTFKDREEDRKRAAAAGVDAFLTKEGFEPRELLETIAALLARSLGLNRNATARAALKKEAPRG